VLYQNSSVSECRARRERRDGKRPVKKGQEKANIKRRWAGDTAISGAGRKKSGRLWRLKKELAKRSLRLMCREDGEGLKAPLTCLRFVPRVERCCLNRSLYRVRMLAGCAGLLYGETSSCQARRIYFASWHWISEEKKTVNHKNGVDCKETAVFFFFFSFLYPNMFVEPLNN